MQVGQVAGGTDRTDVGGVSEAAFEFGRSSAYAATPDLPQVSGDLAKFGAAMDGQTASVVGHTVTYTGTWWIRRSNLG